MSDINVAVRYAQALYQVTAEDDLTRISKLLDQVSASFSEPEIRKFLLHPQTTQSMKYKLVRSLDLGMPLEPFLLLVFEKKRAVLLEFISQEFTKIIYQKRNMTVAYVRSAVELDKETVEEVQRRLEALTRKEIDVKTTVDPSIWGGFSIEVDGKIIDLSLVYSFKQLKQTLLCN